MSPAGGPKDDHVEKPMQGVLSMLPDSLVPLAQLARIDRPFGLVYFTVPALSGVLHAGLLVPSSYVDLLSRAVKVVLSSFFLRIAACAWNDLIDAPVDRQVARTRTRPLARGAMSNGTALAAASLWALAWSASLGLVDPITYRYAAPAGIMWLVYPFLKRVTNLPQVFLSLLQAWNVLLGMTSVGLEPLDASGPSARCQSILYHFVAYFAWQLIFDTVYGFQDIEDDQKVGVKSTAILIQSRAKPILMLVALLMISALTATAWYIDATLIFYLGAVIGGGASTTLAIVSVDLREPSSCHYCFTVGGLCTGVAILAGFLGELWYRQAFRDSLRFY